MNKRASTISTVTISVSVAIWAVLMQSAFAQDAEPENGQVPKRGQKAKACNTILEIDDVDEAYAGHLKKGQRFRFIGPVAEQKHMVVSPVAGGSGPPHSIVPGNHVAVEISSDTYEWAAPVFSGDHDPVRMHLFKMNVTDEKQGCPKEVEFRIERHIESTTSTASDRFHPGHATAN